MVVNSSAKNQPGAWGDFIGKLWVSEYIKFHKPDWEILFDDTLRNGKFSDNIKIPWVTLTDKFEGEHQILTHHRHHWVPPRMNDYPLFKDGKPIFFDLHGLNIKMIMENWFPTFIPTDKILKEFHDLNLPSKYSVLHLNKYDPRWKRTLPTYSISIPSDQYWITTNEPFSNLPNYKDLNPWTKLYILIKAQNIQCSHSGFTSIAACYRKRKNISLIGNNINHTLYMGPPAVSYSNVTFETSNYKKLYYYSDKSNMFSDYFNYIKSRSHDWINTSQYEDCGGFNDWDSIQVPEDYQYEKVSLTRENCLVPVDTLYTIDNHPPKTLTPNRTIVWGGLQGGNLY